MINKYKSWRTVRSYPPEPRLYIYKLYRDHVLKNLLFVSTCIIFNCLFVYLTENTYSGHISILIVAYIEWYRSYTTKTATYQGLSRLLLYIVVVLIWMLFVYRLLLNSIVLLIGYEPDGLVYYHNMCLYLSLFVCTVRPTSDMTLDDKRRYIIHVLFDVPTFILVIMFKLFNYPLNSLYTRITEHCYIGCLPMWNEVDRLNDIGIKLVINMCAEYEGPCHAYCVYNIQQIRFPTVDSTAPTLESIKKAVDLIRKVEMSGEKVFVHCKAGMGRSAAIMLCHLVANESMTPSEAFKLVKEKRPEVSKAIMSFTTVQRYFFFLKNHVQS